MRELLTTMALWFGYAAIINVSYDGITHSRRQARWEIAHPNEVYIPHYRAYRRACEKMVKG